MAIRRNYGLFLCKKLFSFRVWSWLICLSKISISQNRKKNKSKIFSFQRNKSVCELGGGMTCLAGLAVNAWFMIRFVSIYRNLKLRITTVFRTTHRKICLHGAPSEVFLTDGNEASFKNLETICSRNEFDCVVECCLLRWEKDTYYEDLEKRFDFIICADWLAESFFFVLFRFLLLIKILKLSNH